MKKNNDTEQKTGIAKVNIEKEIVGKELSGIDALSRRVFGEWTVNELVDKWEQLEGDYIFLKWQLAKLISDKFKSKVEFGQFLQALRNDNPNHALCTIKQSTFYRYTRAASFCNKFGIYDLKKIGLSPTAIYELSKIKHQPVINFSFLKEIEKKNLPVAEIEQLISQAKNLTIESTSEPVSSPETGLPMAKLKQLISEAQNFTAESTPEPVPETGLASQDMGEEVLKAQEPREEIEKKNLPMAELKQLISQAQNFMAGSLSESALPPETDLVSQEAGDEDPEAQADADQKSSVMMEAELSEGIELPEAEIRLNDEAEQPTTKPILLSEISMNDDQKAQAIFDLFLSLNISQYEMSDILSKTYCLIDTHFINIRRSTPY